MRPTVAFRRSQSVSFVENSSDVDSGSEPSEPGAPVGTARLGRRRRFANIAGLIVGYGFGQGALFAAETILVLHGRFQLLGLFGTGFVITTLLYQLVDCGGIGLLAREVLRRDLNENDCSQIFLSFSCGRMAVALICLLVAALFLPIFGAQFWVCLILGSSVGLVAYAFNAGGLLDGLSLSGWTGITSAIPFVAVASVFPFVMNSHDGAYAGATLGLAYSLGATVCVALQFLILWYSKFPIQPMRPRFDLGFGLLGEGSVYLMGWAPGQLFFRGQILICAALLGPAAAGLLVYVKQIVSAITQVLFFVRRAEFPKLMCAIQNSRNVIRDAFRAQGSSLQLAFLGAVCCVIPLLLPHQFLSLRFDTSAKLLLVFAPSIVTNAMLGIMMQTSIATRRLWVVARANIVITLFAGLIFAAAFAKLYGVAGLGIAEVLSNVLATGAIAWRVRATVSR